MDPITGKFYHDTGVGRRDNFSLPKEELTAGEPRDVHEKGKSEKGWEFIEKLLSQKKPTQGPGTTSPAPSSPDEKKQVTFPLPPEVSAVLNREKDGKADPAPENTLVDSRNAFGRYLLEIQDGMDPMRINPEGLASIAENVRKCATECSDPLIRLASLRIIADMWVYDARHGGYDNALRLGIPEAVNAALKSIEENIRGKLAYSDTYYINSLPGLLQKVRQQADSSGVPEDTLKLIMQLGGTLFAGAKKDAAGRASSRAASSGYSAAPTEKETRKKRELARQCSSMVEQWWKDGRIQVQREGTEVEPGSLNMTRIITEEKYRIDGKTIHLEPASLPPLRGETSSQVKGLLDAAKEGKNITGQDIAALKALDGNDHSQAAAVLSAIFSMACPPDRENVRRLQTIDSLLNHAKHEPFLRELMMPHFDALKSLHADARASECLGEGSDRMDETAEALIRTIYEDLAEAFPEEVNSSYIRECMVPLLCSGDSEAHYTRLYVSELWKKKPGLVAPTLDLLCEAQKNVTKLEEAPWYLMSEGVRSYGWLPDRAQLDSLMARIYSPQGMKSGTIFGRESLDKEMIGCLDLLDVIREKKPELLTSMMAAYQPGEMLPLERMLLQRLLKDPSVKEGSWSMFHYREKSFDRCITMKQMYDIISRDRRIAGELCDTFVEEYEKSGSLEKMGAKGLRALTILLELSPSDDQFQQIDRLLAQEVLIHQPSGDTYSPILWGVRERYAARYHERLSSGTLTACECIDTARKLLALGYHTCGVWRDEDIKSVQALQNALGKAKDAPGDGQLFDRLLSEYEAAREKAGSITAMGLEDVATFHILYHLAQEDDGRMAKLAALARPDFDAHRKESGELYLVSYLRVFFDQGLVLRDDFNRMRKKSLPRSERMEMVKRDGEIIEKNWQLQYYYLPDTRGESLNAFAECLRSGNSPLAEMPLQITDPQTMYRLYCTLAPGAERDDEIAPAWLHFRAVLSLAGGERSFDAAVDLYRYVEQQVAAGHPREKVMEHATACRVLGKDPREVPMRPGSASDTALITDISENEISIDGIRLDINPT